MMMMYICFLDCFMYFCYFLCPSPLPHNHSNKHTHGEWWVEEGDGMPHQRGGKEADGGTNQHAVPWVVYPIQPKSGIQVERCKCAQKQIRKQKVRQLLRYVQKTWWRTQWQSQCPHFVRRLGRQNLTKKRYYRFWHLSLVHYATKG